MRSHFYLIDMSVFRSSPPFFFGLLFDPHAHAYNPFNSQRYTLMAEDAVESAGAKAPAITISIQPFIAGLEVLCHQTIDVPRFQRELPSSGLWRTSVILTGHWRKFGHFQVASFVL